MKSISFLINCSTNTLDHLRLLIKSLKENLSSPNSHEILIFVDSDNSDRSIYNYLKVVQSSFHDFKIITHKMIPCVGYSRNSNLLVELAKYDIVSYLQSDMVISPGYDADILSALEDNCILSATRIEPPLHGVSNRTITMNLGTDPNEFKWEQFQKMSVEFKKDIAIEYFFAPFTFYKKVWIDVGGYDTLFRRSREDSDILQRFIQKGVKIKQTYKANVYHFSCVSSRGKNWFDSSSKEAQARVQTQQQADDIELLRFIRKWGNFNHGDRKLFKYDIDLLWKSESIIDLAQIKPYFSRVWLSKEELKEQSVCSHRDEHIPANQLLKFSNLDWENAERFYNKIDYNTVYQTGIPSDYNVLVTVDLKKDSMGNLASQEDIHFFLSNLTILNDIIAESDPGVYQFGVATLHIKSKSNLAESQIVVKNPPFDYSLLTIE